jgi:hypothetical protein
MICSKGSVPGVFICSMWLLIYGSGCSLLCFILKNVNADGWLCLIEFYYIFVFVYRLFGSFSMLPLDSNKESSPMPFD